LPGEDAACTELSIGMPFVFAELSMDRIDSESWAMVRFGRQPLPSRSRQMSPFV